MRRTGVDYQFGQQVASQRDANFTVALVPATGVDVRVTPRWFLRGELRNFLYRTPASGFGGLLPVLEWVELQPGCYGRHWLSMAVSCRAHPLFLRVAESRSMLDFPQFLAKRK
jgi:hypothetical protein